MKSKPSVPPVGATADPAPDDTRRHRGVEGVIAQFIQDLTRSA